MSSCLLCVRTCVCAGTAEELVQHGLIALRECLPSDAELTSKVNSHRDRGNGCLKCCFSIAQNVSIAVVGDGQEFVIYNDDEVQPYVSP